MLDLICFAFFLLLIVCASAYAAIKFSEPAPDWVEEEELRRDRWYK